VEVACPSPIASVFALCSVILIISSWILALNK
jgi:hypothetical protein